MNSKNNHKKYVVYSFKTIFAKHPSNKGKNKVTKKYLWHGNIFKTGKKNLSRVGLDNFLLTLQEKIEFKVAHISLKTNVSGQFKTK